MPTEYAFLKPWISALLLPPGGPLLALLLGLFILRGNERPVVNALGKVVVFVSLVVMYLAGTQSAAIYLERVALRPPLAQTLPDVTRTFKIEQVQAIVVLGGGQFSASREYGSPALSESSGQRLHYGATLAKQTGLPLAFSGGNSRSAVDTSGSEAAAAQRWLTQLGLPGLRWQESISQDTGSSAPAVAAMLQKDKITNIALVTSAAHMPRALREFAGTSLKVTPAPMGFLEPEQSMGLDWFPSGRGLRNVRMVTHEILGLAMMPKP
jgi:uncharacterized SAM-binding protein YcdF (DUF218 family)